MRDPDDVLVVTQTSAGFFDVRLLEENGVGGFLVAGAEIEAPHLEEGVGLFRDTVFLKTGNKGFVEFLVPIDEAGVH